MSGSDRDECEGVNARCNDAKAKSDRNFEKKKTPSIKERGKQKKNTDLSAHTSRTPWLRGLTSSMRQHASADAFHCCHPSAAGGGVRSCSAATAAASTAVPVRCYFIGLDSGTLRVKVTINTMHE